MTEAMSMKKITDCDNAPYMGFIGTCGPKGYGFSVLVINVAMKKLLTHHS